MPEYTAADSASVSVSTEKWRASIVAHDFEGWSTSVTPDVVLLPPNAAPVIGREAAVAFMRAYPVITAFEIRVNEQSGRGDLAYDHGTYSLALTLPDGTVAVDTGTFLGVFRRQRTPPGRIPG